MKVELAPSILSFDHADLAEPTKALMAAGADWIHCDIMDGQFVPPITFGADLVRSLRKLGPTKLEAHLMTLTPERHFESFIAAGCSRIIFHQEVSPHAHRLAQTLKAGGIQAGIAINPGTDASTVRPLLEIVDMVLVMTVNPGWGAQSFIGECLRKVQQIRSWRDDVDIEVDGGIDASTIRDALSAGANVFVAGNYVYKAASPAAGIAELREACESR